MVLFREQGQRFGVRLSLPLFYVNAFRSTRTGALKMLYEPRENERDIKHLNKAGDDRAGHAGNPAFQQEIQDQADRVITEKPGREPREPCHHGDIR